jgi:hypothetical protein
VLAAIGRAGEERPDPTASVNDPGDLATREPGHLILIPPGVPGLRLDPCVGGGAEGGGERRGGEATRAPTSGLSARCG